MYMYSKAQALSPRMPVIGKGEEGMEGKKQSKRKNKILSGFILKNYKDFMDKYFDREIVPLEIMMQKSKMAEIRKLESMQTRTAKFFKVKKP